MTQFETRLKLYENTVLATKESFTGSFTDKFQILSGARTLFTVFIDNISVGATVTVTIKNSFNILFPFETVLTFTALNANGYFKKVLSDYNNLFEYTIDVSGGSATVVFAAAIYDNANTTRIENAQVSVDLSHVTDSEGNFDSVRIGDGVDLLAINPDGSINVATVNAEDPTRVPKAFFGEATSVPSGSETLVASHTVPVGKSFDLSHIDFGGNNFADYRIEIAGATIAKKHTGPGSNYFGAMNFGPVERGYRLAAATTIKVYVTHDRSYVGDFEATIQGLELG